MESMLYVKPTVKYSLNPYIGGERRSMEFLRDVIDCTAQKRVIIAGRQIGKSTMMAGESVIECACIPGFSVLYAAPDDLKLRTFSYQRLHPMIELSPAVMRLLMHGPEVVNNIRTKRFNNGSMIMITNASREANVRSPTSDRINLDEIQDTISDNLYIAVKSMFTSPYKIVSLSGTPLSMQNPMEGYFKLSTQNQYVIPCNHCASILSVGSRTLAEHHWISLGPKNISREGLKCDRCGGRIYTEDGQWAKTIDKAEYEGFRIPQPLSPFTDFNDLMDEWENPNISLARKMNEIFGISWDAADRFFTEKQLRDACGEHHSAFHFQDLDEMTQNYCRSRHTVAGIDWARNVEEGAETTLMIGTCITPEHIRVVFMSKLPKSMTMEDQVDAIIEKLREFSVDFVVADWGAAGSRNVDIAKAIGRERVAQIDYSVGKTFVTKYHEHIKLLSMNRTLCLSDFHRDLTKEGAIELPLWEDFQEFANDFLVEFAEEDHWGRLKYDHPQGTHDDMLHSGVYMNLARKIVKNIPILHMVVNAEKEEDR
jgi:hypothetical protein